MRRPLAAALCSPDPRLRMHVSEYLLPNLLKIHGKCAFAVCRAIRDLPVSHELAADRRIDTEAWTEKELQYFGLVHVCLYARLAALPTGCELQDDGVNLSRHEMRTACLSGHSDLRLTALNALVASSKTTQLPSPGVHRRQSHITFCHYNTYRFGFVGNVCRLQRIHYYSKRSSHIA